MKTYDFLIIGAGSAGCSAAYFLNKEGKSVAIIDREGIAGGASGAAGAFLSPLPGQKNPYNSLVNDALNFSLPIYEKLLPQAVDKRGVLRVANSNFDEDKLSQNSIKYDYFESEKLHSISKNFRDIEGYFYENAAVIEPIQICNKLIEGCDFYKIDVEKLIFENGLYMLENIRAKNVILSQGVGTSLVEIPYMKIAPIFGLRIDVKTTTKVPFNVHKSISISTNKQDGTISIGATHERHENEKIECLTTCDKCSFYVNSEDEQIKTLLSQADELMKLDDLKVVKIYKGARATIKSYFPVIGQAVDYTSTLKKHPSIKNGTKIPPESLDYFVNLHVINALGSRGFVFGPYLAKILTQNILYSEPIPQEISTLKLFYKMARKS
ncbi:FAD-binding oxidoreductase [Sulfurimonas sp.]|uniref:NAD(P)/FAD-dependent oxidoreductase n=1 Tax=Sulfurimonas sp. TaxID=2022749 RepID=UPI0025E6B5EB|nr:FAD-binding oxidoreductase [Sulfurimonas sp.]MBW6488693.1 FAD-binding oxidoreductase [Sulfurimonas sp.]